MPDMIFLTGWPVKRLHRIALGHHRDDNVEQVLMNLVRGTGPLGLRGIPPVRQKKFIRPLIRMPRADILVFLDEINQAYRIDESNKDTSYLRNRIRHRLIPLLEKEFNPDIKAGIERLSGIISQEDAFLDRMARTALDDALDGKRKEEIELSIPVINKLDRALGARVIRAALLSIKQNLRRISHTHIKEILHFAGKKGESGKSLDLPGQIRVYRQKDLLHIKRKKQICGHLAGILRPAGIKITKKPLPRSGPLYKINLCLYIFIDILA